MSLSNLVEVLPLLFLKSLLESLRLKNLHLQEFYHLLVCLFQVLRVLALPVVRNEMRVRRGTKSLLFGESLRFWSAHLCK